MRNSDRISSACVYQKGDRIPDLMKTCTIVACKKLQSGSAFFDPVGNAGGGGWEGL